MTATDEVLRTIQTDMAGMRADQSAMRTDMASMRADQTAMRADLAEVNETLRRVSPNVEGIPLIHRAVTVLRTDVRALKSAGDSAALHDVIERVDLIETRVDVLEERRPDR